MPHIEVMLWPGRDEETKKKFGRKVVEDAMDILGVKENHLSVSFTEVPGEKWNEYVSEHVDTGKILVGKLYKTEE